MIPLIWAGVLPKPSQWSMLTAPATPPPPPPAQPVQKVVKVTRRQVIGTMLQAPHVIPDHVSMLDEDPQKLLSSDSVAGLDGGNLSISLGTPGPNIGTAPLLQNSLPKPTLVSSANPLLTKAAADAVAKWIYSPTILDKKPVEVVTEITISFALQ